MLSALRPGRDRTTVLRVYEAAGRDSPGVRIRINARIAGARAADLLENSGTALKPLKDTVQFDLHPFEIKTIKLQLLPGRQGT